MEDTLIAPDDTAMFSKPRKEMRYWVLNHPHVRGLKYGVKMAETGMILAIPEYLEEAARAA